MILAIIGIVLIVFGIFYSLKQLLRPSTYGIGTGGSKRGESGPKDNKAVTIFTVFAAATLIIASGFIGYSLWGIQLN